MELQSLSGIKAFLINLLDWIYKKKCYFCHSSKDCARMCKKCYDSLEFLNYDKFISIDDIPVYCAGYYEQTLQKLIRGLKYHNQCDLAYFQAKFMWEYWQNISDCGSYTVIPVPLHKNRQKKRRYNHMELVAQEFCKLSGYGYCPNLIKRVKDTKPQYKLNHAQRALNLAGAFEVNVNEKIEGKILLLDDITTTGATFAEMIKTLKKAGYSDITCFATTTPRI